MPITCVLFVTLQDEDTSIVHESSQVSFVQRLYSIFVLRLLLKGAQVLGIVLVELIVTAGIYIESWLLSAVYY